MENVALITIFMFLSMTGLALVGQRLFLILGFVGGAFAVVMWGQGGEGMVYYSVWGTFWQQAFVCVPLFIFMSVIIERSGIGDALFEAVNKWLGGIKGGLSVGTVAISTLLAAMVGIGAISTVILGLIAVPALLKRHYNKHLVIGAIQAGGALGFLIPPSAVMIIYGLIAHVSVGHLFIAGIIPGLMLAMMYSVYILIKCKRNPELGPAVPEEERASLREKFVSLRLMIMPLGLIFAILGFIFFGVTSISEAATIGAIGSLVCAAISRRLDWDLIKYGAERGLMITGMAMWIVMGGMVFAQICDGLGASAFIGGMFIGLGNKWLVLGLIQLSFFGLGMFLDDLALLLITAPIYLPLAHFFGFDPIWFGILYIVNMQMAYLTPPFGYCLFVMKAVVPKEVTLTDIYRSIIPFVVMQGIGLAILIIFPQIALWLPSKMIGG